jgi:hypothetical protein
MIDKRGGKVAYAVMSFGGFLGIGDECGALPWSLLKYNERLDAYELNVTEGQLRYAPMPAHGLEAGGSSASGNATFTAAITPRRIGDV